MDRAVLPVGTAVGAAGTQADVRAAITAVFRPAGAAGNRTAGSVLPQQHPGAEHYHHRQRRRQPIAP